MATAWPRLRILTLGILVGWGARHPPRATIRGLIPLVEHCPDISDIGYRMRADVTGWGTSRTVDRPLAGDGVMARHPIRLNVGDSRIHNAIKVASFLSDISPQVLSIHSLWNCTIHILLDDDDEEDEVEAEEMLRKWDLVAHYVPHFGMVRMQERIFALTQVTSLPVH
ncbi:hypothetical protein FOMPIDRAFT_44135 [Fomitopsis schrenkii]|uniref:Uncharacterized protein n=1 Tax=Fomitopsis schrenkii TaxID=2126942 RepID=S8EGA3_FOMSC|nr:hypothetical protein FOMPIDRAFT_44135 [Fomitopsis schrenkii]